MSSAAGIEAIIDALYDASADASRWPAVLADVAELFESDGAQIGHVDLADNRLSFIITHGYEYTPERIRQYEALMGEDPRLAAFAQRPFLPMHCRMIVSDEELHASRLYREVLAPDGVEYSLGVNLVEEQQSTTFFILQRRPDRPQFGDAEVAGLAEMVPHLRRVLRLYRRFADFDRSRLAALEALDQVPLGVFVVGSDRVVATSNRMAQEMIAAGDGLAIVNGRLSVTGGQSALRLYQAIDQAVAAPSGRPRALMVQRANGEPLRLLVSSLPGARIGRTLAQSRGDLVVIFASDPGRSQEASWEQLQHMFGLFPGEAKLLALLTAGETINAAAAKLGLTQNSARQYLKGVFAKTGTHRQSELIRKVMDSPLWINKRGD